MGSVPAAAEPPQGPAVVQPVQSASTECLHWAPVTDLHWLPGFKVPRQIVGAAAPDRPATVRL